MPQAGPTLDAMLRVHSIAGGGREGGREGGRKGGRKAGREGGREEGREKGRKGGREGGREGERQEGRKGGRKGGREGGTQPKSRRNEQTCVLFGQLVLKLGICPPGPAGRRASRWGLGRSAWPFARCPYQQCNLN